MLKVRFLKVGQCGHKTVKCGNFRNYKVLLLKVQSGNENIDTLIQRKIFATH